MGTEKLAPMPRKVTQEDKELARNFLMPYYGKNDFSLREESFAQDRSLTPNQVKAIVLELRRKATLE